MSPWDKQKERVPAHETGHPDESTNTIGCSVNLEQAAHDAAVDEALGFSEPGELAPFFSTADVISWQVKRAALLALLHLETRSFQEVASSLGVTKAAISKEYISTVNRLGWGSLFRKLETRKHNAEAAARRHAKRAATAPESAGGCP